MLLGGFPSPSAPERDRARNLSRPAYYHNTSVFISLYHNSNSYYRLLLFLSVDISLNPGPFHNLQPLDHDEWNIFKHRGAHFLHLSINSLLPKTDELRHMGRLSNAAVIGISESKLDDSVLTSEIQIDEYDLLRCDRNRHGGGVACYTKNLSEINLPEYKNFDNVNDAYSNFIQKLMESSDKVIDLAHFTSGPISKTMIALIKKNLKKIQLIFIFYTMKLFGFL